jgi:hypothetical protein
MTSFKKQMNLYGFKKIHGGTEAGSYQHPMFRKDSRHLASEILLVKYTQQEATTTVPTSSQQIEEEAIPPQLREEVEIIKTIKEKSSINSAEIRELQFKSTFHQSSYSWRQMLEITEIDAAVFDNPPKKRSLSVSSADDFTSSLQNKVLRIEELGEDFNFDEMIFDSDLLI